ncbi:putative acylesterase/phospholipase RssA [Sphingomonas melonis]|uniref:Putative acylesterase/phospholipase RssA n=1 Tax=Sphingomonas melonis TaxID=152682 RepID=A0A7Y9FL12_9SPHN|nr:patatin-like phospholipase family protein [Sphingomonas melonis]NYD89083.1 putative acylesterase/phospholipase RssA [Sphingomonas melonis]
MVDEAQVTRMACAEHPDRDFEVVLVLSGGNALGAFQAGVYEALHNHGLEPDWIVGASIGAINGALIAGSRPEARIDALRSFWRPHVIGPMDMAHPWLSSGLETSRRSAAAAWTAIAGRAGIFGPLLSALMPWSIDRPSIFETEQLAATLNDAIDFTRLNDGSCRFTATALDLQTGEDAIFDTDTHKIGAHHIRASAAPSRSCSLQSRSTGAGSSMAAFRPTCLLTLCCPIHHRVRRSASRSTFCRSMDGCPRRSVKRQGGCRT